MSGCYKRDDFSNGSTVRWCPGCGDYAILMAIQRALAEIGTPPESHVFVSGIGCAGRLPYYMNAYGFHTIHGRALPVATGLSMMRPELTVWVIMGDGDALSIGGNHFIHALRRNVNVKILLINNQVYGLTKGQFSPTSPKGQVTDTSPTGVMQGPVKPLVMALASGGTFVARAVDKDPTHLAALLQSAYHHKGTSCIEIYQDCHIFNPGAFDAFSAKTARAANTLLLKAGEPMLVDSSTPMAVVRDGDALHLSVNAPDVPVERHDPTDWMAAMRLANTQFPAFPVPLGIYYQVEQAIYQPALKAPSDNFSEICAFWRRKGSWRID